MIDADRARKASRGRILIVDDDPNVRGLLNALLRQEGFETRCAGDGPTALATFGNDRFDMIFTDFAMPRMTGLELAAVVRARDPAIPIILVTGHVLDNETVTRAGINGVLQKPFRLDELLARLNSLNVNQPV